MKLKLIYDYFYGNDERAINRHHTRHYKADNGNNYFLDKNLSLCPPEFEMTGPCSDDFRGIIPVIPINGERYWGKGLTWEKAEKVFLNQIGATLFN